jgi:hypothetical protein
MISSELAAFLESGVAILVGTRDARLVPDATRAIGARVGKGGAELTVFLPDVISGPALANLRDNGRVAVAFSRAADHRTFQVKGQAVEVRPATAEERAVVDRFRCAWASALSEVGLPPRITLRMAHWPAHAVRVRVERIFVQTPGPGAGAPLGRQEGTR